MEGLSRGSRIPDVLVFVMGWVVSSFFWTVEQRPLWWWDNLRYVVVASPVLLWLALRETEPREARTRVPSTDLASFGRRFALLMVVFVAIALVIVAFPAPYAHVAAMDVLDSRFHPGDIVALDGVSPEAVLPYLSVQDVSLVAFHVGVDAGYLLTAHRGPYPGFVEIVSFASGDLVGEAFACALWGRVVG